MSSAMNRWMVLIIVGALMGVWVGVPALRLVPDGGQVRLFTGLALGAFALGYVPAADVIETPAPVLLWRRFAALMIDLVALFMILDPVLGGFAFLWGAVIGISIVFSYFWLHGRIGRATLGQAIMGYHVVPALGANEDPEFAYRTVMGFGGLCLWPVTIIAASQEEATPGVYYWDRETNTRAVRVMGLGR